MTHSLTSIPAESDLLCEGCGYTLNGLPEGALCPECAKPTAESAPNLRQSANWERVNSTSGIIGSFITTTLAVLFRPTAFYRTLATRQTRKRSRQFAGVHWVIVSLLFGIAAYYHFNWYRRMGSLPWWADKLDLPVPAILALTGVSYLLLLVTTRFAATLTTWEAGYRGLRLPLPVVLRGLDYHAAHYLPVGLIGAGTVVGYHLLDRFNTVSAQSGPIYLYVLCGEVLLSAVYLFLTYWIGMKNMMYANA
ncbi:MAG TPA: hypothetical protein VH370_22780 [Humisphaera sp.]|jgi:hypothetical protein|nr:hypothetical protein [Humisphaera sp.]